MPTRYHAVDNAADVQTGFTDQIAAQFDDQFGARKIMFGALCQVGEVGADRCDVECLFARKVRDALAAAEIERADRGWGLRGEPQGEVVALVLSLDDGVGFEILGAGKKVKAFEIEVLPTDCR